MWGGTFWKPARPEESIVPQLQGYSERKPSFLLESDDSEMLRGSPFLAVPKESCLHWDVHPTPVRDLQPRRAGSTNPPQGIGHRWIDGAPPNPGETGENSNL